LEIEGETVSEESSNEMSERESESESKTCVLLHIGGWEDVTVGDDERGEMLPNEAIGPSKRQESIWGDKT
jgi:hypothetical protein